MSTGSIVFLLIAFLLIDLALIIVFAHFERRDLYDRLMAHNLAEYKDEHHESVKSAHRRVLDNWEGK